MALWLEINLQFFLLSLRTRGNRIDTARFPYISNRSKYCPASVSLCSQTLLSSNTDSIISPRNYLHKIIGDIYRKRKKRRLYDNFNAVLIQYS